jgi:DNA-binding XRE family transcriptional regulator
MGRKSCSDIFEQHQVGTCTHARDDCSSHRDMDSLPFSGLHTKVRKPLGIKYIKTPVSVGEKIRNRRLELRLLQRDIAGILEVSEDCITNWENNRARPLIHNMAKVIKFLGFNPAESTLETLSEKIKKYRLLHGLSHKKMGKLVGVNASTIGSWEKEEHRPHRKHLNQIEKKLSKLFG